jgi:hypothetical protein
MSSVQKFYRTFGYLTLKTDYTAGNAQTDAVPKDRQWYNFFSKGGFRNCITDATSTPSLYTTRDTNAGDWLTPVDFQEYYGNLYFESPEATTIWCLCAENNRGFLPYAEPWVLNAGESTTLEVGTKLFFCEGRINLDPPMHLSDGTGSPFTEVALPTELHIKDNPVTATASANSYGIKFL